MKMTTDDTIADLLAKWEEAWEHGTDIPAAELSPTILSFSNQFSGRSST